MNRAALALATAAGLLATAALAQPPRAPSDGQPLIAPGILKIVPRPPAEPALTPEQVQRLLGARVLRRSGRLADAERALNTLRRERPHHAAVLAELAQVYADRADHLAVIRLAQGERSALRDSILLGHELSAALENTKRVREAADVAIQVWVKNPVDEEWAFGVLARGLLADSRGVRDALRRAVALRPTRADLVRALVRLEWKAGDLRPALAALGAADRADGRASLRWSLADEMFGSMDARDSTGAIEVLLDLAGDRAADPLHRSLAAGRAWDALSARGVGREGAARLSKALADLPPARWSPELRLGVARALRERGDTDEVRRLLSHADPRDQSAEFELERALVELRDGPPEKALPALRKLADSSPEGVYRYAEALFYGGQVDSAHAWFTKASENPRSPFAGAALERLYLIEEAGTPAWLPVFGRASYAEWRGDRLLFRNLADSLYRSLPRGALWAQSALLASSARADDPRAALAPLTAVADSLPDDRLAPLARERAGDLLAAKLRDEAGAIAQWEECLARYPRAWNSAEVRRKLERLRRERRL